MLSRSFLESLYSYRNECKKELNDAQSKKLNPENGNLGIEAIQQKEIRLHSAETQAIVNLNAIDLMIDNYWSNHGGSGDDLGEDVPF